MGFLILCFILLHLMSVSVAAAASGGREELNAQLPGFLYTRDTGRCTPQFWGSGREVWPKIVPQESALSKVFGSRVLERYETGLTLFEATQRNDDVGGSAFSKLVKQSTAALLNAYARPGFPYSSWEVKSMLIEALVSEEAAASQAKTFEKANHECV